MNCTRCQGLMIKDHFLDFEGTYGQMWTTSWRCVHCGQVYDSVIEQNVRLDRNRSWCFHVESRTTRMTKSILEQRRSPGDRLDRPWPCDPSMRTSRLWWAEMADLLMKGDQP